MFHHKEIFVCLAVMSVATVFGRNQPLNYDELEALENFDGVPLLPKEDQAAYMNEADYSRLQLNVLKIAFNRDEEGFDKAIEKLQEFPIEDYDIETSKDKLKSALMDVLINKAKSDLKADVQTDPSNEENITQFYTILQDALQNSNFSDEAVTEIATRIQEHKKGNISANEFKHDVREIFEKALQKKEQNFQIKNEPAAIVKESIMT